MQVQSVCLFEPFMNHKESTFNSKHNTEEPLPDIRTNAHLPQLYKATHTAFNMYYINSTIPPE